MKTAKLLQHACLKNTKTGFSKVIDSAFEFAEIKEIKEIKQREAGMLTRKKALRILTAGDQIFAMLDGVSGDLLTIATALQALPPEAWAAMPEAARAQLEPFARADFIAVASANRDGFADSRKLVARERATL